MKNDYVLRTPFFLVHPVGVRKQLMIRNAGEQHNINNLFLSLQVPSWVTQLYMIAVFTAVSCRVVAAAVLQYRLIFCQPSSTSLYFILQPRYLRLFEHQKSQIDLKIIQQVLYLTLKVIKCKKSTKIWQEDES